MAFMALSLKRTATIRNFRLALLLRTMQFCVAGFIGWNFIYNKGGTVKLANRPVVFVLFDMMSIARSFNYDLASEAMCSTPTDGQWRKRDIDPRRYPPFTKSLERFHCSRLFPGICPNFSNKHLCVDFYNSGRPLGPSDLEMRIKEKLVYIGTGADAVFNHTIKLDQKTVAFDTFFSTFTQWYSFNFSYTYTLESGPPFFFGLNRNMCVNTNTCGGTNRNSKTVLLDQWGLPLKVFEPGEELLVPSPQLLQIARGEKVFGNAFGPNQGKLFPRYPGSESQYPSWVWHTGATVHAVVSCFSDDYDIRMVAGKAVHKQHDSSVWRFGASLEQPVCLLSMEMVKPQAFELGVAEQRSGLTVRFDSSFVRVRGKAGRGFFRIQDANQLLMFITSAMVLIEVPRRFLRVIVLSCLGRLSKVYKKIIDSDFNIPYMCARSVAQMVSQSVCFTNLVDSCGNQALGCMTKEQLQERVYAVVKSNPDLDENEIGTLTDFAIREAMESDMFRGRLSQRIIAVAQKAKQHGLRLSKFVSRSSRCSECSPGEEEASESQKVLDMDSFCRLTGNEYLGLEVVAPLFDHNRRGSLAERFFMDHNLRNLVYESRKQDAARSMSKELDEDDDLFPPKAQLEPQMSLQDFSIMSKTLLNTVANLSGELKVQSAEVASLRRQIEELRKELEPEPLQHAECNSAVPNFRTPPTQPAQAESVAMELSPADMLRRLQDKANSTMMDAKILSSGKETSGFAEQALLEAAAATQEAAEAQLDMLRRSLCHPGSTNQDSRCPQSNQASAVLSTAIDRLTTSQAKFLQAGVAQMNRIQELEVGLKELGDRMDEAGKPSEASDGRSSSTNAVQARSKWAVRDRRSSLGKGSSPLFDAKTGTAEI